LLAHTERTRLTLKTSTSGRSWRQRPLDEVDDLKHISMRMGKGLR
jgi:hypothetical protein